MSAGIAGRPVPGLLWAQWSDVSFWAVSCLHQQEVVVVVVVAG